MNANTPEPAPPPHPSEPVLPPPRRPFNEISVLFPLLAFYTVAYLGLTAADFALQQTLELPDGMMPLYIALLGAYAADKEIRRWLGTPELPRKGTVFVYLWLLLFLAFYMIHVFQPDLRLPGHLLPVCLQVLGIFFGSKASKHVFAGQTSRSAKNSEQERQVLELLAARGKLTRKMLADERGKGSVRDSWRLRGFVRDKILFPGLVHARLRRGTPAYDTDQQMPNTVRLLHRRKWRRPCREM